MAALEDALLVALVMRHIEDGFLHDGCRFPVDNLVAKDGGLDATGRAPVRPRDLGIPRGVQKMMGYSKSNL
jgi:hypothetical protein